MTKIIGLTGGIGSGKTMVSKYLISKGFPVYIADDEAKKVMQLPAIKKLIENSFGKEIYNNEVLNRENLAKIVFNNPKKLDELNHIVHPEVKINFDNWVLSHKNNLFVFKEAAILFESGSYKYCDAIINITAPIETRIKRVMERDKSTRENILNRINNQWNDEQRIGKSDYIIHNITVKETKNQVDKILKLLKNQ